MKFSPGELFLFFLFIHYVFDFCLQTDFISKYKQELFVVMFVHVFTWTMALLFAVKLLGMSAPWWMPFFLYVGHYFSDDYKCWLIKEYKVKDEEAEKKRVINLFHWDQLWHVFQVAILTYFVV